MPACRCVTGAVILVSCLESAVRLVVFNLKLLVIFVGQLSGAESAVRLVAFVCFQFHVKPALCLVYSQSYHH